MAEIGLTETSPTSASIVASIVQDVLRNKAVIMPSVTNYSGMIGKGASSLKIPKRTQFTAATKLENTALTSQELIFTFDELFLSKHEAVYTVLEDIASIQSSVSVEAEIIKDMADELAIKLDAAILAEMKLTSATAPDHRQLFANTPADTVQEADIIEGRRLLDVANVPSDGRILLVHPDQEANMLKIANFIQAERFGSNDPVRNGQIGRVYGMDVLKSNLAAPGELLMYHASHCGWAMQKAPSFKQMDKLASVGREYLLDQIYGVKVLDGGKRGVLFNATGA